MKTRREFITATTSAALAFSTMTTTGKEPRDDDGGENETATDRPDYGKTGAKLIRDSTPLADGFFMPGEERKHEATVMVFPPEQNWQGHGMKAARHEWTTVANAISEHEEVRMVVHPHDLGVARKLLSKEIKLLELAVNDGWARDTAPLFLKNAQGERRATGFTFNGWGAKFPPFSDDALLKARLCARWKVPFYPSDLVGEGGGVLVDGDGTLIVTEECLLHKNRNPALDRAAVEKRLLASLGAKKVIWLGRGLTPDPVTDGHVDGMAAFAQPGTVLLHSIDEKSDPNFKILADAKRRLAEATDAQGRKLTIIELPLAGEVSQMNFYLCNGAVIVPVSGKQDDEPLGILREVFAGRKIVGVPGRVLAKGGGGVHCITQQVPA